MMIQLSARLAAVAALVPAGAKVADVGTDHGYLPIYLATNAISTQIVATDLRPGPLDSARRNVRETGLESCIRLSLCDGLEDVQPGEAEVVILAGMGGETMCGILSRAPWALEPGRLLLLQPQSKQELLRRWLCSAGCGICSEHLVQDGGKLYPILTAAGGVGATDLTPGELLLGRWPPERRDALFHVYLEAALDKLRRAIRGLEQAEQPPEDGRLAHMRAQLTELERWRR